MGRAMRVLAGVLVALVVLALAGSAWFATGRLDAYPSSWF